MTEDRPVDQLIQEATRLRWSRRQILRRAGALGLSAPAIAMVLAACGGDDDDDEGASSPTTGGGAVPTSPPAATTASTPAAGATPSAAATTAPTGGGATGGIINMNTTLGDSGIANPILTGSISYMEYYIFNRLMIYDDTGTLQPELAEDWSYSDDNLVLTINLRDAPWHDGTPFTSADVIFTFETIADESTDTNERSKLQINGELVSWEAPDEKTVVITTPEPFAPFLFNLQDIGIIPKHVLENVADINTDAFNKAPIGTGPYTLGEWQPDQFFKLVPFADYWGGAPANDGLTFFFHADTDVGSAALDAGEIDMMFTPPELQGRYETNPDFKLYPYVYYTPITVAFNHKHPVLSDITVRKAIAMAIDKTTLTDTVTKGRGIVADNQFANTGPLDRYNDYGNTTTYAYDVDAANALLDEAGYARGDGGIRVSPDGDRLSFNIITYSGFEEYVNDQVILQEMLGEIGIELTPQVVDYTSLEAMWADPNDDPANRALELEEWPHPYEFDPDLYNELHSDNHPPGLNYMWFSDPDVDDLISTGRVTTDPAERESIYKQLDVRRSELIPAVPLYCAVDGWVASTKLANVPETPYYRRWVLYGLKGIAKPA